MRLLLWSRPQLQPAHGTIDHHCAAAAAAVAHILTSPRPAPPTPAQVRLMRERGYRVGNIDCTIIAQRPKLSPHKEAIRANLCGLLGADPSGGHAQRLLPLVLLLLLHRGHACRLEQQHCACSPLHAADAAAAQRWLGMRATPAPPPTFHHILALLQSQVWRPKLQEERWTAWTSCEPTACDCGSTTLPPCPCSGERQGQDA